MGSFFRTSALVLFALVSSVGTVVALVLEQEVAVLLAAITVVLVGLSLFTTKQEPPKVDGAQVFGASSYRMLDKLGEGGMGEVFRAFQEGLKRTVALKRIKPFDLSEDGRGRFRREARVLSALTNPHTINVFDAGIQPDGTLYYVMELLDGFDLQSMIEQFGPLCPARVIHVLRQATMSLSEAHQRGLVHRDLKPANLMLCRYGGEYDFVKVLDFGLVKVGQPDADFSAVITTDDVLPGTPAFLAPEAILGSGFVDARADIYSLGALAHYLLSGRYLFDVDSPIQMVQAQLRQQPPLASERSSQHVPPELDELIESCLQKERDARPQSAEDLLKQLEVLSLRYPWTREHAAKFWADVPARSLPPQPPLPSELSST
jgi:serine/threonine-protein kinase